VTGLILRFFELAMKLFIKTFRGAKSVRD